MSYAIDVSQPTTNFDGIRQAGYNTAIIRAYRSTGAFDPHCLQNISRALAAGMQVEVYMFPSFRSGNPAGQVDDLLSGLGQFRTLFIWVDIELRNPHWSADKNQNQQFVSGLFDTLDSRGASWGVYTNWVQWDEIVGNNWTRGSNRLLWYPHYDGKPDFTDFRPFGGWAVPFMKQYAENAKVAGMTVDLNLRA